MASNESFAKPPAIFSLGGVEYLIAAPTNRDMIAVGERMKAFAQSRCVSPLDYVIVQHAHLFQHAHLAPVLALAIGEAIKLGSGNGTGPDEKAIIAEYTSLDGLRWRVWYHISRLWPDFSLEGAKDLVTEDNLIDVAQGLDAALRLAHLDPKDRPPTIGTSS